MTRNGWLTSFSTDFSLCTCCSCFSRMTSGMLITFRAKKCLAVLSLTSCTRPNVPVPAGGDGTRGCMRTVKETVSFGAPNPSIWRLRVLTRSAVLEVHTTLRGGYYDALIDKDHRLPLKCLSLEGTPAIMSTNEPSWRPRAYTRTHTRTGAMGKYGGDIASTWLFSSGCLEKGKDIGHVTIMKTALSHANTCSKRLLFI